MNDAQERALDAIGDGACESVVRLQGGKVSAADHAAFMEWLRQSPRHVQEYLQAEVALLAMQNALKDDPTDVRALLEQAPRNVVNLGAQVPKTNVMARSGVRTRWALAAVVVLAVGALFGARLVDALSYQTYGTSTGEQRRVVLSDGSRIDLNTQSRIRVRLNADRRDIHLAAGEAFFDVAKDSKRPFTVFAGEQQIRALGTAFSVRRERSQTSVILIEGKVSISSAAPHEPFSLAPGQRLTLAAGSKPKLDTPAIGKVTAWRERRLVFEYETLANVAAEFNRYNTRQILIEDVTLAGERINGVFDADKPQNLLDFLAHNTGARIADESAQRVIVTRADPER